MPFKLEKEKIFAKIAALRTLNDGYPEFKLTNSYPSINTGNDGVALLIDLIIMLFGREELKITLTDYLSKKIDNVLEVKVKNALKNVIKSTALNGTNPSIPASLIDGIEIGISDIDLFGLFKVDPLSEVGGSLYEDQLNGLDSGDFNTFLYEVLQNPNNSPSFNWGHQNGPGKPDILQFEYTPSVDTNILYVQISPSYDTNKKLGDVIDDFIDGLKLFNTEMIVNQLVDKLFGTISNALQKTADELFYEEQMSAIIKRFAESEENVIIDDSFYEFTNKETSVMRERATNRANGIRKLKDCDGYTASIPYDELTGATSGLTIVTTQVEKETAVTNTINTLIDLGASNTSEENKHDVELGFLLDMIEGLVDSLMQKVLKPHIILITLIISRVLIARAPYVPVVSPAIAFVTDNAQLVKSIVGVVKDGVVEELLGKVVKNITELSNANLSSLVIEASKQSLLTLLSLVCIPQNILEKIRGLGINV